METNSFSRVWDLLHYVRFHKWTNYFASVASGLLYAALVILLGLFVDLLVNRGRIPHFAQLSQREQAQFLDHWRKLPVEQRTQAVSVVQAPVPLDSLAEIKDVNSPKMTALRRTFQQLVDAGEEDTPPVPAEMTAESLKEWAARRKVNGDAYRQAAFEHELRWMAFVRHTLATKVSESAADKYIPEPQTSGGVRMPGLGEEDRRAFGILGLVVD